MSETLRTALRVFIPEGTRLRWVALVGLALLVAIAETATAYFIFRVFEFATDPPSGGTVEMALGVELSLTPLLIVTACAFAVRLGLSMVSVYAQARIVQSAGASVSSRIHRRYLEAPYEFHLTRSSSESIRTVLWSVDQATLNVLNPIVSIATQTLITITLFGLLVAIAPTLSLIALVVIGGGLTLIFALVQPRLGRLGKLSEDTVKHLLASVRDSFDSVRDIKAYRTESYFDRQFRRHRVVLARLRSSKSLLDQVPPSGLELMVVGGLLVLVGVAQGGSSFSQFVPVLGAFGYAALRVVPSLNKIVAAMNRFKYGQQAMRNVENDLVTAVPAGLPEGTAVADAGERLFRSSIQLRNITYSYPGGTEPAVRHVDLDIRRGEMLAIAGGSGSGKSTLADLLLGLLAPTEGAINLDGEAALPAAWYQHVGIVSQSVVLLDASLRENVAFGAGDTADDTKVIDALETARLGDWLATVPAGLDTMVGESGKLLSGGERQRVAIARSLYRRPDLLILDEATSALDGATELALIEAIHDLDDLTTIVVSHRLAPIRAADRVAMMDQGRITAVGTYEDLVADALDFRDLVGL
jgi:ABC-type multidrug transport system fused ATPase/permease subunit